MVFLRVFSKVLLFGKYFLGFLLVAKYLFWVVQEYPTPVIPVCRFVKSTPWDITLLKILSATVQNWPIIVV